MFNNSRFSNPILLAFSDENKPIFLSENKIICGNDIIEKLDNFFLGFFSLKTKPKFLILSLIRDTLVVKEYSLNFSNFKVRKINIEDIDIRIVQDLYMDIDENVLYIVYQDINNNCNTLVILKDNYTLCTNTLCLSYDIETFFNSSFFLISNDRPGFGKAAKVIDINFNVLFEYDRFLSYCSNYLLFLIEYNEYELIVLKNMINNKTILSKRYNEPIINAKLLESEYIVLLLNKGKEIMVDIISIKMGGTIKVRELHNCNIEIHSVNSNYITIKGTSMKEGIKWGYIDKNGTVFFSHNKNKREKINTDYFSKPYPITVHKPLESKPQKLLFSLHGGPESFEFDDLRYYDLYSEAIKKETAIVVLNYYGSAYQNYSSRKKAWKNWINVIKITIDVIKEFQTVFHIKDSNIILIGGSFGATLALLIAANLNIKINKVIAIAPLMNLNHHLKKVSSEESEWFNERFSVEEIKTVFDWKNFINDIKTEVYIIQGDNDSVLNYRDTLEAVKYANEKHLPWTLFTEVDVDHVPLTDEQRKNRFILINNLI
ncbi:prolyl oligopeptidase family serine peptidase [Staphylococcus pseudintermedius]|nr:prolyl oligopeptidase family serine peptidase [Staphylococcus pseudintermedius]